MSVSWVEEDEVTGPWWSLFYKFPLSTEIIRTMFSFPD